MRKKLIVGNWKMNLNASQASILVHRLDEHIKLHRNIEVVLAPNMFVLQPLSTQIDHRKFKLAAQNAYFKDEGAFTGEVSFTMLHDLVRYAIIGHSERRIHFGESLDIVKNKVAACVRNGITPILCVGETKLERLDGETEQVLHDQITTALSDLTPTEVASLVIAYEPVWAIGTGVPEKPHDIKKAVASIRKNVAALYGEKAESHTRVLYGASVEPDYVHAIMSIPGVDGLLVGGASLNYHKFAAIVDSTYKLLREGEA